MSVNAVFVKYQSTSVEQTEEAKPVNLGPQIARTRTALRRHRGILCSSRRRLGQLLSAIRAIRPSGLNGLITFRARWLQQSAAARTEWEFCLFDMPAAGARLRQSVAENEVQDHPDRIGNEGRQQRPHYVPHLPPLRVAVDVSDQRNQSHHEQENSVNEQRLSPAWPFAYFRIRWCDKDEQRHREAQIGEPCNDPRCLWNHAQFLCEAAHASLLSPRCRIASITAATPPASHPSAVNAAKLIHVWLNCGSSKLPKRPLTKWKTGQLAIVSSHANATTTIITRRFQSCSACSVSFASARASVACTSHEEGCGVGNRRSSLAIGRQAPNSFEQAMQDRTCSATCFSSALVSASAAASASSSRILSCSLIAMYLRRSALRARNAIVPANVAAATSPLIPEPL